MDGDHVQLQRVAVGTAVAAVALGTVLLCRSAVRRYLRRSKEALLMHNKQPSAEEWAAYRAERDAQLACILNGSLEGGADWYTPYDLVPGRLEGAIAMSDFLESLKSDCPRTGQMVVETLLAQAQQVLGASVPLPLTWFLPKRLRSVDARALDVLRMLGIVSPLLLGATADGKNFADERKRGAAGQRAATSRQSPLPSRVRLEELESYFADEKVPGRDGPVREPREMSGTLFPGLKKGWSTRRHQLQPTQAEARRNKVLTELCNRLMFNDLLAMDMAPPGRYPEEAIALELPDGSLVTSLAELAAFLRRDGCEVELYIRIASAVFGAAFTAEREEEGGPRQYDVPFALFMRTGVYSEEAGQEAKVPLLHAGIHFKCSGTLASTGQPFDCGTQFYISQHGVCGWNARNGIQDRIPWNEGKIVSRWTSPEDVARALELCAATSAMYTSYATAAGLAMGGYALIGVCVDSVAAVQLLMDGSCSLYPLMALPRFKVALARHTAAVAERLDGSMAGHLRELAKGLMALPSDCVLDTCAYEATLRRIKESIPWAEGNEPFVSTALAFRIINSELARVQQ